MARKTTKIADEKVVSLDAELAKKRPSAPGLTGYVREKIKNATRRDY